MLFWIKLINFFFFKEKRKKGKKSPDLVWKRGLGRKVMEWKYFFKEYSSHFLLLEFNYREKNETFFLFLFLLTPFFNPSKIGRNQKK